MGLPTARSFHGMTSAGGSALVCGGHGGISYSPSSTNLVSDMCWWMTPVNFVTVRWDPLRLQGGSEAPERRSGHSLTWDKASGTVVLWGGLGNTTALSDCWMLQTRQPLTVDDTEQFDATYSWKRCGLSGHERPDARWSHIAQTFHSRIYIHGGFARDNRGNIKTLDDMWVRQQSGSWAQIEARPAPRALHAAWIQNLNHICMAGGEGRGGHGLSAVIDETWCYDIVQNTWMVLPSSLHAPIASQLAIAQIPSGAIALGGLDSSNHPSQELYEFGGRDMRWRRVSLAGPSPARRTGHVSFLNPDTSEMFVSLGQTAVPGAGGIVNDLWVLDLGTNIWRCIHGEHFSCASAQVFIRESMFVMHFVFRLLTFGPTAESHFQSHPNRVCRVYHYETSGSGIWRIWGV